MLNQKELDNRFDQQINDFKTQLEGKDKAGADWVKFAANGGTFDEFVKGRYNEFSYRSADVGI